MPLKIIAWPAFKNKKQNPYNWLLYTNIEKNNVKVDDFTIYNGIFKKYNIFHIHWPDTILNNSKNIIIVRVKALVIFTLIKLMKARGTKIVWTVHNLKTHEEYFNKFEKKYWQRFLMLIDGTINLTESGYNEMLRQYDFHFSKKNAIVPHGHYIDVYENNISKYSAKDILGIPRDSQVITFIGQIREYKNVTKLIEIYQKIHQENIFLIIAGKPKNSMLLEEILKVSNNNDKIKLFLDFIPDQDMQLYLNSSDIIVLPYKDILNSGSALLSLSFGKPILVPNKGALRELKKDIGEEWVLTYEGELTSQLLVQALKEVEKRFNYTVDLSSLDWDRLADQTIKFYKDLLLDK
ncbi:glycosyltransferase [Niallia nealsonii AAU1]|nr:glycosyltransferase [Niallia nealsonii AAU1]